MQSQMLKQSVINLVDEFISKADLEFLLSHDHGGHHVFISGLDRHFELFAKDIQPPVTANISHQMVATLPRFAQWRTGRRFGARPAQRRLGQMQTLRRSPSLQFAIAIGLVMPLLESQALLPQGGLSYQVVPSQEALPIMIVELFDDTIAPRLLRRDKPGFDSTAQTQTNQMAHASGMSWTAI